MNWIKIVPNFIFASVANDFVDPSRLTQAQINWLWDAVYAEGVDWMFAEYVMSILKD